MKLRHFLIATLFILTGCQSTKKAEPGSQSLGFIGPMKQFTLAGARAGEGYFSQDGRYLIFQSEREKGNPFYQIYLMDLQTGATQRVSPGQGKTTCAWIHPSNKKVLYASTHADPKTKQKAQAEYEERKKPKSRYSWSFDETYEIYEADHQGRGLKNLTKAIGYDAEGSYSPDGQWIAFASNRAGYDKNLSEEDKKRFAMDPSYMMDIYIMRADGKEVRRLTTSPGYDGGPFFSPDGKRITFRRFTADGKTAEVFTMNIDGTDQKQITRLKMMSWAPYYHPSGDYLIFATNVHGHANFELYIVDTEGRRAPVRVTDLPGFDGLPVFTPDGSHLLWTHTNESGEAQLYLAPWNDGLARSALKLKAGRPIETKLSWLKSEETSSAELKNRIVYLTQEKFGGRMTGAPVEREYAQTLADDLRHWGYKPGAQGSFLQSYEFVNGIELGAKNRLLLKDKELKVGVDWIPLSISKSGLVDSSPTVFAGYGIVAPANGAQAGYDSFEGLDVKNKWVLVFQGLPEQISNERRYFLNLYSRLPHKALMARQRGARGLIVVNDSETSSTAMALKYEGRADDAGLPVLRISEDLADQWFAQKQSSRKQWTQKLAKGEIGSLAFDELTVKAEIDLALKKSRAVNVVGLWPVPGAKETIVIGAHLDHLGFNEGGNSLAPKSKAPHVGADDNASGVAAAMQIAQNLSVRITSGSLKPKQNILIGLWTGEEIGILGSSHFVKTNKDLKLTASLNFDMVGRLREALVIQGTGSAKEWKEILESLNAPYKLPLRLQSDPYLPTDALSFYLNNLPSVSFFTGSHSQYHTPEDKEELINYSGLTQIVNLGTELSAHLASSRRSLLNYEKVQGSAPASGSGSRAFRLYLGTIPDYTQEGVKGVRISGTSKDSPAEKAGLVAGDVITELGGIKIQNINDYVYCLQALKANEKTKLRVLRAGAETELEITPALKSAQ